MHEYVVFNRLTPNQLYEMTSMLKRCFRQNVQLTQDYMYLINTTDATGRIDAMASVKYEEGTYSIWNVCATSFGKISHATKSLLEYGMPLILTSERSKAWLVLELENPYWAKALSLYTSLGFVNIITASNQFQQVFGYTNKMIDHFLKKSIILYTTYDIYYKVRDGNRQIVLLARNRADNIRKKRFDKEFGGVGITADMAAFGQEIVKINKEYAGYLTVDSKYDFNGIGNITGGNPIYKVKNFPALSEIYDTSKQTVFHFHTHPSITDANNQLEFNPPSLNDIRYIFETCGAGLIRGYIFTSNGIFAYSLTRHAQAVFCKDNIDKTSIYQQYQDIIDSVASIYVDKQYVIGNFLIGQNDLQIQNLLIDYYLESVLTIEFEGKPVFDIKYWPYSFILKTPVVDSFFVSRTIGERLQTIGNVKTAMYFTSSDMSVFNAIQQGEEKSCSPGYISFLLGADKIKLGNCLPYSYVDLDKLFKEYNNSLPDVKERILNMLSEGLPLSKILRLANQIVVY